MFNTLSYIGNKLNENGILWGVGASILLNHHGLVDKPRDIDILVALEDINKADTILKSIGEKKAWEKVSTYSTKYFYEYVINGFEVDVMSGLRINHSGGMFEYTFDKDSISEFMKVNGEKIPLTSLEDWYVLYQLMPNREEKVNLIQQQLLKQGIRKTALLERMLESNLPKEVREKVERMLSL